MRIDLNFKKEIRNLEESHLLYLITMEKNNDKWTKIGVTRNTMDIRLENYRMEGYVVEVIKTLKMTGFEARAIESVMVERGLDFKKKKQFLPGLRIVGYSECYCIDYLDVVKSAFTYIEGYLKRLPDLTEEEEDWCDMKIRIHEYKNQFKFELGKQLPPEIWTRIERDQTDFKDYEELFEKYIQLC